MPILIILFIVVAAIAILVDRRYLRHHPDDES
jgi:hypothetical protein